jgi:hypothetical protein
MTLPVSTLFVHGFSPAEYPVFTSQAQSIVSVLPSAAALAAVVHSAYVL